MVLALAVAVFTAGTLAVVRARGRIGEKIYEDAAAQFTEPTGESAGELPPLRVDFESLRALNPDVIGWIFCPGTGINYPVVHGPDNEYYMERSYNRTADPAGAVFSDAANALGFADPNVILYGRRTRDMTMFSALPFWAEEEYFHEHPILWLLTPERDYRVELFSVYTASASSDAFTVFHEPGPAFDRYLAAAVTRSLVKTDEQPEGDARYVLLSERAVPFENDRTALHGKLVPLDSAGGRPLPGRGGGSEKGRG